MDTEREDAAESHGSDLAGHLLKFRLKYPKLWQQMLIQVTASPGVDESDGEALRWLN